MLTDTQVPMTEVTPQSYTITRESIMNFQTGQRVSHEGREGKVVFISKVLIRVLFDNMVVDWIDYSQLRIIGEPEIEMPLQNAKKKWSPKDLATLIDNSFLSNEAIAKVLGRTAESVRDKRCTVNKIIKLSA